MDNLQIIEQRELFGKDFKIYGDYENPLFLAKDVAEWIEHSDVTTMLRNVDEHEKMKITPQTLSGGLQINTEYWFLTEDGLYEVLMQSRKPIAKQFKAKVKEILRDIRKHGMYANAETLDTLLNNPDAMITMLTRYKEEKQKRLLAESQAERLSIQLDESKHWYTLKRVAQLNRIDWKALDWKLLKTQSRKMNLKVDKIFDANFGTVNSYHEDVWKSVYPNLVY